MLLHQFQIQLRPQFFNYTYEKVFWGSTRFKFVISLRLEPYGELIEKQWDPKGWYFVTNDFRTVGYSLFIVLVLWQIYVRGAFNVFSVLGGRGLLMI